MKYKNLVFLGTSHIAKQSLDEVKKYISNEKPDIIALELDRNRLQALMSKKPRKIELLWTEFKELTPLYAAGKVLVEEVLDKEGKKKLEKAFKLYDKLLERF